MKLAKQWIAPREPFILTGHCYHWWHRTQRSRLLLTQYQMSRSSMKWILVSQNAIYSSFQSSFHSLGVVLEVGCAPWWHVLCWFHAAISNSFGFGGHNSCVVFAPYKAWGNGALLFNVRAFASLHISEVRSYIHYGTMRFSMPFWDLFLGLCLEGLRKGS